MAEKVLMDTGTATKAVREAVRAREAYLLVEQCGFAWADVDRINAQLDALCYSGWMDDRLGRKINEVGCVHFIGVHVEPEVEMTHSSIHLNDRNMY